MSLQTKYTFDEVRPALLKQAKRVSDKFKGRYEINELVNEVWIKGNIHKLGNIKYVSARAFYDMIDYIRSVEGRENSTKFRTKFLTSSQNTKQSYSNNELREVDKLNFIKDKGKSHVDLILDKDEAETYLASIPKEKSDLLRKYFLEEMSLTEIGKGMGLTKGAVCHIKKQALKEIRHNFFIEEEILPEYVVDYEIENNKEVYYSNL